MFGTKDTTKTDIALRLQQSLLFEPRMVVVEKPATQEGIVHAPGTKQKMEDQAPLSPLNTKPETAKCALPNTINGSPKNEHLEERCDGAASVGDSGEKTTIFTNTLVNKDNREGRCDNRASSGVKGEDVGEGKSTKQINSENRCNGETSSADAKAGEAVVRRLTTGESNTLKSPLALRLEDSLSCGPRKVTEHLNEATTLPGVVALEAQSPQKVASQEPDEPSSSRVHASQDREEAASALVEASQAETESPPLGARCDEPANEAATTTSNFTFSKSFGSSMLFEWHKAVPQAVLSNSSPVGQANESVSSKSGASHVTDEGTSREAKSTGTKEMESLPKEASTETNTEDPATKDTNKSKSDVALKIESSLLFRPRQVAQPAEENESPQVEEADAPKSSSLDTSQEREEIESPPVDASQRPEGMKSTTTEASTEATKKEPEKGANTNAEVSAKPEPAEAELEDSASEESTGLSKSNVASKIEDSLLFKPRNPPSDSTSSEDEPTKPQQDQAGDVPVNTKSVMEPLKMIKKGVVATVGGSMVGLGLVMIPLPTPFGVVVASSGLAVLGTEFDSAREMNDTLVKKTKENLEYARDHAIKTIETMDDNSDSSDGEDDDSESDDDDETPQWLHMNAAERKRQQRQMKLRYDRENQTMLGETTEYMSKSTGAFLARTVLPFLKRTKGDAASEPASPASASENVVSSDDSASSSPSENVESKDVDAGRYPADDLPGPSSDPQDAIEDSVLVVRSIDGLEDGASGANLTGSTGTTEEVMVVESPREEDIPKKSIAATI